MAEAKSKSSGILFGIIGLVLGLGFGFMITDNLNKGAAGKTAPAAGMKTAGPVKGDEKLPQGHPSIDNVNIEEEVKMALQYGQQNQDYDAQLKVGSFLYGEARRLN